MTFLVPSVCYHYTCLVDRLNLKCSIHEYLPSASDCHSPDLAEQHVCGECTSYEAPSSLQGLVQYVSSKKYIVHMQNALI